LLADRGWTTEAIGTVITVGAIVGVCRAASAGTLVDDTTRKRACVIVVGLAAVVASAVILMSRQFRVVAATSTSCGGTPMAGVTMT
jgi:hypothetical protein